MRIIKKGTWNKQGSPIQWIIDCEGESLDICKGGFPGLMIQPNGEVLVNGIEIVEWTEERKKIMEEKE
jgi:hypothetical protein